MRSELTEVSYSVSVSGRRRWVRPWANSRKNTQSSTRLKLLASSRNSAGTSVRSSVCSPSSASRCLFAIIASPCRASRSSVVLEGGSRLSHLAQRLGDRGSHAFVPQPVLDTRGGEQAIVLVVEHV